jgi:hypothetical protein
MRLGARPAVECWSVIPLERRMIQDQERLRRIQANAQLAVEQLSAASGLESFGFDAPSVEWLEGYIERQRANNPKPDFIKSLSSVLGCFLGECIIRTYGGHWTDDEQYGLCVAFNEENAAFPLAKVRKQFDNGVDGGDGIYSFFTTIPVLFHLQRPPAAG